MHILPPSNGMVSFTNLSDWPSKIEEGTTSLILSNNSLRQLNFFPSSVRYLDVQGNLIASSGTSSSSSRPADLSHLVTLSLARNRIVSLRSFDLSAAEKLVQLDLRDCFLSRFDIEASNKPYLPSLKFLCLAGNCLTTFSIPSDSNGNSGTLQSLIALDLSRNQLTSSPDVSKLPSLRIVLLDEMRIGSDASASSSSSSSTMVTAADLRNASGLENSGLRNRSLGALRIRDNQVGHPKALATTSALHGIGALDLDGNSLRNFDGINECFPGTEHLSLRRNKISIPLVPKKESSSSTSSSISISTTVSTLDLPCLETLRVCYNVIEDTESLRGCRQLKRLYLTNCGLRVLRPSPAWSSSLKVLDASFNRLRDETIASLSALKSLEILRLRGNKLRSVTNLVKLIGGNEMRHLVELDVRDNPLILRQTDSIESSLLSTTKDVNGSTFLSSSSVTSVGSEKMGKGGEILVVDDTPLFSVNFSSLWASASSTIKSDRWSKYVEFPQSVIDPDSSNHISNHSNAGELEGGESAHARFSRLPRPPVHQEEQSAEIRSCIIECLSPSLIILNGYQVTAEERRAISATGINELQNTSSILPEQLFEEISSPVRQIPPSRGENHIENERFSTYNNSHHQHQLDQREQHDSNIFISPVKKVPTSATKASLHTSSTSSSTKASHHSSLTSSSKNFITQEPSSKSASSLIHRESSSETAASPIQRMSIPTAASIPAGSLVHPRKALGVEKPLPSVQLLPHRQIASYDSFSYDSLEDNVPVSNHEQRENTGRGNHNEMITSTGEGAYLNNSSSYYVSASLGSRDMPLILGSSKYSQISDYPTISRGELPSSAPSIVYVQPQPSPPLPVPTTQDAPLHMSQQHQASQMTHQHQAPPSPAPRNSSDISVRNDISEALETERKQLKEELERQRVELEMQKLELERMKEREIQMQHERAEREKKRQKDEVESLRMLESQEKDRLSVQLKAAEEEQLKLRDELKASQMETAAEKARLADERRKQEEAKALEESKRLKDQLQEMEAERKRVLEAVEAEKRALAAKAEEEALKLKAQLADAEAERRRIAASAEQERRAIAQQAEEERKALTEAALAERKALLEATTQREALEAKAREALEAKRREMDAIAAAVAQSALDQAVEREKAALRAAAETQAATALAIERAVSAAIAAETKRNEEAALMRAKAAEEAERLKVKAVQEVEQSLRLQMERSVEEQKKMTELRLEAERMAAEAAKAAALLQAEEARQKKAREEELERRQFDEERLKKAREEEVERQKKLRDDELERRQLEEERLRKFKEEESERRKSEEERQKKARDEENERRKVDEERLSRIRAAEVAEAERNKSIQEALVTAAVANAKVAVLEESSRKAREAEIERQRLAAALLESERAVSEKATALAQAQSKSDELAQRVANAEAAIAQLRTEELQKRAAAAELALIEERARSAASREASRNDGADTSLRLQVSMAKDEILSAAKIAKDEFNSAKDELLSIAKSLSESGSPVHGGSFSPIAFSGSPTSAPPPPPPPPPPFSSASFKKNNVSLLTGVTEEVDEDDHSAHVVQKHHCEACAIKAANMSRSRNLFTENDDSVVQASTSNGSRVVFTSPAGLPLENRESPTARAISRSRSRSKSRGLVDRGSFNAPWVPAGASIATSRRSSVVGDSASTAQWSGSRRLSIGNASVLSHAASTISVSLPANPHRLPISTAGRAAYHMAKSIAQDDLVETDQMARGSDTGHFSGSASMMSGSSMKQKPGVVSQTIVYELPRSAAKAPVILHEPVVWSNSHTPTGSVIGGGSSVTSASQQRGRITTRAPSASSSSSYRGGEKKNTVDALSPTQKRLEKILHDIETTFARMNQTASSTNTNLR
jgi:Leucine-rich repeat (LRR) protein